MRIRLLSDLHTEFLDLGPKGVDETVPGKSVEDVVVLAGDIAQASSAVSYAANSFTGVPVILVPGNHEYYGRDMNRALLRMREDAHGTNVHLLDNDEIVLGGVRFLGSTLWTDFELFGADENRAYALAMARGMSDFRLIRYGSTARVSPGNGKPIS
jgi:predicted phosphohydrolase